MDQIRKLGSLTGADYVLYGKAVAVKNEATKVQNLFSTQATLSLRLVRVADGEILSAASVVGSGLHTEFVSAGSKALSEVARQAAEKIVKSVATAKAVRETAEKVPVAVTPKVTVTITKVTDFNVVNKIVDAFKGHAGVKDVRFISFENKELKLEFSGLAAFEVGSIFTQLEKVVRIEVLKVTSDTVSAEVK